MAYSVLMSVYAKENAAYFSDAVESMLHPVSYTHLTGPGGCLGGRHGAVPGSAGGLSLIHI